MPLNPLNSNTHLNKLIILDRDGVINVNSKDYIKSLDEFKLIPDSINAIVNISRLGYKIAICTNQSGLARGYFSLEELEKMHHYLLNAVQQAGGEIHKIEFCPHHPDDGCDCRKPKTLMLEKVCAFCGIYNYQDVYMVGDSISDIQAIKKLGGIPILVKTGNGLATIDKIDNSTKLFDDLYSFSKYLEGETNVNNRSIPNNQS